MTIWVALHAEAAAEDSSLVRGATPDRRVCASSNGIYVQENASTDKGVGSTEDQGYRGRS